MERIDKPWGYELRFIRTERYAGKLLFIKAGSQLSLQYHERKDEAFLVHEGTLELVLGRGKDQRVETMQAGWCWRIEHDELINLSTLRAMTPPLAQVTLELELALGRQIRGVDLLLHRA